MVWCGEGCGSGLMKGGVANEVSLTGQWLRPAVQHIPAAALRGKRAHDTPSVSGCVSVC